jgi:hypothetical protein
MPSGYTVGVADGSITERNDFILKCARGMGACIMQRDDDPKLPPKLQDINQHHVTARIAAKTELVYIRSMKIENAEIRAKRYNEEKAFDKQRHIDEVTSTRNRYNKMLDSIMGWIPPSKDHEEFKQFMIKQLLESIEWDCTPSTYYDFQPLNGQEWLDMMIKALKQDIEYHKKYYAEEVERTTQRNKWITELYGSL